MTRYSVGLVLVLALGVMGCSETAGNGTPDAFPCTEQGILDAISVGGGPHTFDCDGPQIVVTAAQIVINNDVILDGEGKLTVDGGGEHADPLADHTVFSVADGVTAELRGFTVTGGWKDGDPKNPVDAGGIDNHGTLTLTNSTVSGNAGQDAGGILLNIFATLTLTNSTVSGNTGWGAVGGMLAQQGTLTLTNSTVSGNSARDVGGIFTVGGGTLTLANSTVSGNTGEAVGGILVDGRGTLTLTNSIVSGNSDGDCDSDINYITISNGYNIESPGDSCGFDQPTDQVSVSADDLELGLLQDNGGPTETHALGADSVAIDQIPAVDCVDADDQPLTTDQRGFPRDSMCDIGAFEVQP